jgi:serine protease Do
VLKVESEKPLKALSFGDSDNVRIGDAVIGVSDSGGPGDTVTKGVLRARSRAFGFIDELVSDPAIKKNGSGGPLINMQGEVVGVNAANQLGNCVGLASNAISPVVEQLEKFGVMRRGWLGVRIQPVDDSIADSLGLGTARGALVSSVDSSGPAKAAGFEVGDVIVKFDGKDIKVSGDLALLAGASPPGRKFDLELVRKGKALTLSVTLGMSEDATKIAKTEDAAAAGAANAPPPPPPAGAVKALNMTLSALSDQARKTYGVKESVNGVLISGVEPKSPAANKGLKPGDVIEEVNQQAVSKPSEVNKAIDDTKKSGKKKALLYVVNSSGEARFVVVEVN